MPARSRYSRRLSDCFPGVGNEPRQFRRHPPWAGRPPRSHPARALRFMAAKPVVRRWPEPMRPVVRAQARILMVRQAKGRRASELWRRPYRLSATAASRSVAWDMPTGFTARRPVPVFRSGPPWPRAHLVRDRRRARSGDRQDHHGSDHVRCDRSARKRRQRRRLGSSCSVPPSRCEEAATAAGTVSYELLTSLGQRYTRGITDLRA
jgi:hypothetical protein